MRAVLQRVDLASVYEQGNVIGSIEKGLLILLAVTHEDTKEQALALAKKTANMRIFSDGQGKMNLSLLDVDGHALVVPNFTLYADCSTGRRPYFAAAAQPEKAKELYEEFVTRLAAQGVKRVETGKFGADMKVSLTNDGPVTIIVDTNELR